MALTWQDVAGRVEMPDFSGSSALITKGIETLGASVKDIIGGPEERRRAQLAKEMAILEVQQKAGARTLDSLDQMGKTLKANRQEKDMREFGAAQSILEAAAADAALQGKSFQDFMQTDTYAKLGEGARAYGASHLSDAFYRGQQVRDQRLEREQNNRVQEAQLMMQRENLALSRQAAADARHSRKLADEAAEHRLDALRQDKKNREFLATPLGELTVRAGNAYIEASGRRYADEDWAKLAKQSGIENYSEYKEGLAALNAKRDRQKLPPLPEGAAKALLAGQIGKNGWFTGIGNEVDGFDIDDQLVLVADLYDTSLRESGILAKYKRMQDRGESFTDAQVLAELAGAKSVAQPSFSPTTPEMQNAAAMQGLWDMSRPVNRR